MTAVFPVTVAIGCKGAAAGRTGVLIDSFPLDHGHLQASLKHYVDGTTEVGWVDVEHTVRAKDTPRPVVFRDSALRKQIASVLGWETFNADRMFETLSGICVNVDMVTLHFKNGGTKQFQYIQPKQIHRKRKETT